MEIYESSWYTKWYKFCCKALDVFLNREYWHRNSFVNRFSERTDLCTFFKILFFGTLAALVSYTTLLFTFFVIFVLPFILFPAAGVALVILLPVVLFISLGGLVIGIYKLLKTAHKAKNKIKEKLENSPPTFFTVAKEYYKGFKGKYCPTVSIKKKKDS